MTGNTSNDLVLTGVDTTVDTLVRMARPVKKQRAFRATDEIYDAAMAEAERRGEYLSEAIVRFLEQYAAGTDSTRSPAS